MPARTPAQIYAFVIGGTLVAAGIAGFFYSSSFGSPGRARDALGLLSVNGWHNLLHVASGVLGLLAFAAGTALWYALGLGLGYVALAVWGAAVGSGGTLLAILPVNAADTVLHALVGVLGLAAFGLSRARTTPVAAAARE